MYSEWKNVDFLRIQLDWLLLSTWIYFLDLSHLFNSKNRINISVNKICKSQTFKNLIFKEIKRPDCGP